MKFLTNDKDNNLVFMDETATPEIIEDIRDAINENKKDIENNKLDIAETKILTDAMWRDNRFKLITGEKDAQPGLNHYLYTLQPWEQLAGVSVFRERNDTLKFLLGTADMGTAQVFLDGNIVKLWLGETSGWTNKFSWKILIKN